MRGAFDDAMMRLRGPIIDRALDVCLTGAANADAAIERATAAGWPAFEELEQGGERWRTSEAPTDENAAKIGLMIRNAPSTQLAGSTALQCVILGPPGLAATFQNRFDNRVPGSSATRLFTVDNDELAPAGSGSSIRVGPQGRIGRAEVAAQLHFAAISIELVALQ
jgi:hypothetical protein